MPFLKKISARMEVKTNLTYKLKHEDGDTYIRAYEDKKVIGSILITEEYVEDDGEYPFGPYRDQPFFDEICAHENVVNIQDLNVIPDYQGKGVASELMKRAMKNIKSLFPNTPVYINASPYGTNKGMPLDALINFCEASSP